MSHLVRQQPGADALCHRDHPIHLLQRQDHANRVVRVCDLGGYRSECQKCEISSSSGSTTSVESSSLRASRAEMIRGGGGIFVQRATKAREHEGAASADMSTQQQGCQLSDKRAKEDGVQRRTAMSFVSGVTTRSSASRSGRQPLSASSGKVSTFAPAFTAQPHTCTAA